MTWHLPHQPLIGRVLVAQLAALAVALAVSASIAAALGASARFLPTVVGAVAAISAVSLGYVGAHHPFPRFGPANVVTTIRGALACIVAGLIGESSSDAVAWTAAILAIAVALLDGVDGWLARRSGMASPFGARFDMEIDALLIMLLAVVAWQFGKAGVWIVLAGAMRYLFVAAGYVWRWLDAPLPPSIRRKTVCVVQIVGLGIVVSPFLGSPSSIVVAALTLAVLTWSFGVDVLWLRRHGA